MLQPSIILSGRTAQPVNALAAGQAAGQAANDYRYQNDYRNAVRQYGAGAMSGDQAAMNALAAFDPTVVQNLAGQRLNMDATRLGMEQTRLGMDATRQQMRYLDQQAAAAVQAAAAQMTEQQRAQQAAAVRSAVASGLAARTPQEWDALMAQSPETQQYIGQFERREMIAGSFLEIADMLDRADAAQTGPELPAAAQALAFRAQQAGLQPGTPEYQAFMANGGTPRNDGFTVEMLPDGTTRVVQGGAGVEPGRMDPTSTSAMIATIDGILRDPALNTATGVGSVLQNVPGTGAYRFGTRARQLEGQAFLQAFESLKGAGQITEIEGAKATQAIGRLDTGQSADDYRQALTELREILVAAQARPPGWAQSQERQPVSPNIFSEMSSADLAAVDRSNMSPEELQAWRDAVDALLGR